MILKNSDYSSLANDIKENAKRVIIYGAGMIGQIIVPYLVKTYDLYDYVDCFIDADKRKKGQKIHIDSRGYEIKTPDYLETYRENQIILITHSKFLPILKILDNNHFLDEAEGYIVPMMQIHEIDAAEPIHIERLSREALIPKKIHYCWFGGKDLPEFLQKCIQSWRQVCPDYEIIEWNEKNYDVSRHRFTREAYEKKKYGFVTDMARLDILYENGGIYLDTDVTLLQSLDECLYQSGFIGVEKWGNVNSGGGCGFIKNHPMVKKILDYRDQFTFILEDGSLNIETNGMYETRPFIEAGFKPKNTMQIIEGVSVYPSYVTHPYDYMSCEMNKKESTLSVHHFWGGWMEEDDRLNRMNTQEEYRKIVNRIDGNR